MAFKDKDGIPIINTNGNLFCASMNCKTITNANDTISFSRKFGNIGCYSIGKQFKSSTNQTAIPIMRFLLTNPSYGALHCEFILCGTQSGLGGFVIKYDCVVVQTGGSVFCSNAPSTSVADNVEFLKINVGSDAGTAPTLSKVTTTTTSTKDTITFHVTPGVSTGANVNLFYRIMNGGSIGNTTITLL